MLVASPSELNAANKIELFPNEVIRAKMLEEFGFDSNELTSIKVVVGLPARADRAMRSSASQQLTCSWNHS